MNVSNIQFVILKRKLKYVYSIFQPTIDSNVSPAKKVKKANKKKLYRTITLLFFKKQVKLQCMPIINFKLALLFSLLQNSEVRSR